jgi:hypothetical protein
MTRLTPVSHPLIRSKLERPRLQTRGVSQTARCRDAAVALLCLIRKAIGDGADLRHPHQQLDGLPGDHNCGKAVLTVGDHRVAIVGHLQLDRLIVTRVPQAGSHELGILASAGGIRLSQRDPTL